MSGALLCGGAQTFDEKGEALRKQDMIRWRESEWCSW
jgi:hypothetical protein